MVVDGHLGGTGDVWEFSPGETDGVCKEKKKTAARRGRSCYFLCQRIFSSECSVFVHKFLLVVLLDFNGLFMAILSQVG